MMLVWPNGWSTKSSCKPLSHFYMAILRRRYGRYYGRTPVAIRPYGVSAICLAPLRFGDQIVAIPNAALYAACRLESAEAASVFGRNCRPSKVCICKTSEIRTISDYITFSASSDTNRTGSLYTPDGDGQALEALDRSQRPPRHRASNAPVSEQQFIECCESINFAPYRCPSNHFLALLYFGPFSRPRIGRLDTRTIRTGP